MTFDLSKFVVKNCPDCFYYIPNFIDEKHELKLLDKYYSVPKSKWTHLSRRRLQNWGGIPHIKGMIKEDIPDWIDEVMKSINNLSIFVDNNVETNHALLNEYKPGEGIMPHHDGPLYYPIVATLSLGSHTILNFYRPVDEGDHISSIDDRKISRALIEPRSLYLMTAEIYSHYMHGIDETQVDFIDTGSFCNAEFIDEKYFHELSSTDLKRSTRVSFTIRKVLKTIDVSKKFKF